MYKMLGVKIDLGSTEWFTFIKQNTNTVRLPVFSEENIFKNTLLSKLQFFNSIYDYI